jgi:hypothetical protein
VCEGAESSKVVPDAFEVLVVVVATAGGVTDESRREITVDGESVAKLNVLLTSVVRVSVELG